MQKYLRLKEQEQVLEKYIALKTAGVWYMPIYVELKELLAAILAIEPMRLLFSINKVLRIIEKFFDWLYNELQALNYTNEVSRLDIEAAQKVETIITKDITVPPPTIKVLAREVTMSESKLKKIFKVVYGLPPYEFYQKQRMQKAMVLLQSGEHSIKDVGYSLGYSNLSNFTLAFKKAFGQLPSAILKRTT